MHKTYLDGNGSDFSLSNVSTWLHTKKLQSSDRNKKRVSLYCLSLNEDYFLFC